MEDENYMSGVMSSDDMSGFVAKWLFLRFCVVFNGFQGLWFSLCMVLEVSSYSPFTVCSAELFNHQRTHIQRPSFGGFDVFEGSFCTERVAEQEDSVLFPLMSLLIDSWSACCRIFGSPILCL